MTEYGDFHAHVGMWPNVCGNSSRNVEPPYYLLLVILLARAIIVRLPATLTEVVIAARRVNASPLRLARYDWASALGARSPHDVSISSTTRLPRLS